MRLCGLYQSSGATMSGVPPEYAMMTPVAPPATLDSELFPIVMRRFRPLQSRGHQGAYHSVATFLMSVLCYSAKVGVIGETKGQAHEKGTEGRPQEKRAVLTLE